MRKSLQIIVMVTGLTLVMVACEKLLPPVPDSSETLAEPVEGLTPDQLRSHLLGDEAFAHVFSGDEGLGPIYVATSCEGCHAADGKGHPFTTLTRFARFDGSTFDPLIEFGGPQLQHRSIAGYPAEEIPEQATGVTRLIAPATTGLGFLESVSDADILAMADPNDLDGDGISGVPSLVDKPAYLQEKKHHQPQGGKYIGRFGRKAGAIDLLMQTANAYRNDIGITSEFVPDDLYNPKAGSHTGDDAPDPEVENSTLRNAAFYMRTLKAPTRRDENNSQVVAGEKLFAQTACESCHRSTLKTTLVDIDALSNKVFHPYTDLLLHDMGPELDDNYSEGSAKSSEWRTTPLWGLGLSEASQGGKAYYLHDGRATTLEQAIEYHGGEAAKSRDNFRKLSAGDKENLLKFLKSL